MHLLISGLNAPVSLVGCDEMGKEIVRLLRGWAVDFRPGPPPSEPVITVVKDKDGYRRYSPWTAGEHAFHHRVDAACDFLVDLTRAFVLANPEYLCLHCAAVRTKGGLVVFPSTYEAGKSTLVLHLAHAGAQLFADDVMPLAPDGAGVAPGILPRMRLPLTGESRKVMTGWLKARKGASSKRFAYFGMKDGELAAFGERAPIVGLVMLQRNPSGPATLQKAGTAEMLKQTIVRNFSKTVKAIEVIDRLNAVVDGAQRYSLTYASAEDAVRVLKDTFPFAE